MYILDEPTGGLDPLMQQVFYDLASVEKEKGRTIFLSSHLLTEVEHICDRICIIKEGSIVAMESIAALKEKMGKIMEVTFADAVTTG